MAFDRPTTNAHTADPRTVQAGPIDPARLRAVPGVPETRLSEEVVAGLPTSAPPAPWDCVCDAVVWLARARGPLPASVGAAAPGRPLVVIGAMVRYLDTPVGAYDEVLGAVAVLEGRRVTGTVPFMAVDSLASLVGGRHNWSLPKTLASFSGSPADGAVQAEGDGWAVGATARAAGPSVPTRLAGRLTQPTADGKRRTAALRSRGRVRPALVTVTAGSRGPLPAWLAPGRHPGVVVRDARFTLGAPA